jgi:hypothetical protein
MLLFFCVACYFRFLTVSQAERDRWTEGFLAQDEVIDANGLSRSRLDASFGSLSTTDRSVSASSVGISSPVGARDSSAVKNDHANVHIAPPNTGEEDDDDYDEDDDYEDEDEEEDGGSEWFFDILKRIQGLYQRFLVFFQAIGNFLIANVYIAVLILMYFCVLEEVSVVNSVYVVILIVFATHPPLARKSWWLLVLYTEFQIVLEFIWGFSFTDKVPTAVDTIIGVTNDSHGVLWKTLKWDIAIFVLAIVQIHVYRYAEAHQRNEFSLFDTRVSVSSQLTSQREAPQASETSIEPTDDADTSHVSDVVEVKVVKQLGLLARKIAADYCILIVTAFLLIVVLTSRVTVLKVVYVALFFLFLNVLLASGDKSKAPRLVWVAILAYSALSFVMCYLFQFKDLSDAVIELAVKQHASRNNDSAIQLFDDIGLSFQSSQTDRFFFLVCYLPMFS